MMALQLKTLLLLLLLCGATAWRYCYNDGAIVAWHCCCYSDGDAVVVAMALLLCGAATEIVFVFFSTRQLQERKREREREKGARFETCFSALLVSITPAPSCNNANSLRQHQHTHPPATVVPTITQELTSKRNLWLST
jgi:hypothetical protein